MMEFSLDADLHRNRTTYLSHAICIKDLRSLSTVDSRLVLHYLTETQSSRRICEMWAPCASSTPCLPPEYATYQIPRLIPEVKHNDTHPIPSISVQDRKDLLVDSSQGRARVISSNSHDLRCRCDRL